MLYRNALGEVLRETRTEQRRTLRWVSQQARIALGYLSEVERGQKEISSELLDSVATALSTKTYELAIQAGYKMALYDDFEISYQSVIKNAYERQLSQV